MCYENRLLLIVVHARKNNFYQPPITLKYNATDTKERSKLCFFAGCAPETRDNRKKKVRPHHWILVPLITTPNYQGTAMIGKKKGVVR